MVIYITLFPSTDVSLGLNINTNNKVLYIKIITRTFYFMFEYYHTNNKGMISFIFLQMFALHYYHTLMNEILTTENVSIAISRVISPQEPEVNINT